MQSGIWFNLKEWKESKGTRKIIELTLQLSKLTVLVQSIIICCFVMFCLNFFKNKIKIKGGWVIEGQYKTYISKLETMFKYLSNILSKSDSWMLYKIYWMWR